MKPVKWIVLISLLLLLLVLRAFLLHPLVRFSINLYLDRFDRAESVYLSGIRDSERLDKAAREQAERERQIAEREKHRAARKLARTDRELER